MTQRVLIFWAAFVAGASSIQAQDQTRAVSPPLHVETSVSLGAGAQLTATRVNASQGGLSAQSFDPSGSILGSARQSFKPWLGYSLNLGYTRTTQENFSQDAFHREVRFAIPSNVYEVSTAYLVQKHFARQVTGFASLGGGILAFLPVQQGDPRLPLGSGGTLGEAQTYQSRPLGVGSVGLDFRLSRQLALRAEYRGLIYKFPDHFNIVPRATTETSQPTVSVVYRFGSKALDHSK